MIRYFINYEDFLEHNKLNIDLTLDNPRLNIIKKNKNGIYRFEPILYFSEKTKNLLSFAKKLNYNKKGILMVELYGNEYKEFDELFIKKYYQVKDNEYKKYIEENKENIKLINLDSVFNMTDEELSTGNLVVMMPCLSNNDYMYICADRGVLSNETSIIDRRNMLKNMKIGSDIYFHTNDEFILERYKNDITEIREVDFHKYEIINQKFIVMDAINYNDLIGFSSSNYYILDLLLQDSIPVYIKRNSFGYTLDIEKNNSYNSKGYLLNMINFNRFIKNDNIIPLLKYISVYELNNKVYNKISLEKDVTNDNFKYLKKNNKIKNTN